MDARTFDQWTAAIARRPNRRGVLGLLTGGVLGGVLAQRGLAPARAAQRLDSDGDGLFDDDETDVYGTNPDVFDSDGDGVGDGEEVYVGTDPTIPDGGAGCPAGQTDCGGYCADLLTDAYNCSGCGNACPVDHSCQGGTCVAPSADGGAIGIGDTGCCTDSDGDGLVDGAETYTHGTDPNDPDTDNDGWGDGLEITGCVGDGIPGNPLDPNDRPPCIH